MFPFVSRARFEDMRERAYRAESLVDQLLNPAKVIEHSFELGDVQLKSPEPEEEKRELDPLSDLPPLVEDAIRRRVPQNSPAAAQIIEDVRTAVEALGPDFDEVAYAEKIMRGTRVTGWPM